MREESWKAIGRVKHSLRRNLTTLTKVELEYANIKREMVLELEDLDKIMSDEDAKIGLKEGK